MIHDMILSVGWITQYFAAPLGISHGVVHDELQMKKVSLCWAMKHNLSGDNLLQEVSSEMEDTSERHLSESPAQKTAKSLMSTGKVVATVFWDAKGLLLLLQRFPMVQRQKKIPNIWCGSALLSRSHPGAKVNSGNGCHPGIQIWDCQTITYLFFFR